MILHHRLKSQVGSPARLCCNDRCHAGDVTYCQCDALSYGIIGLVRGVRRAALLLHDAPDIVDEAGFL